MSSLPDYPEDEAAAASIAAADAAGRTQRKPSYPIKPALRGYLTRFRREVELPVSYGRLASFREAIPLSDADGRDTLWETVLYPPDEMAVLKQDLRQIYALLKVDGDLS